MASKIVLNGKITKVNDFKNVGDKQTRLGTFTLLETSTYGNPPKEKKTWYPICIMGKKCEDIESGLVVGANVELECSYNASSYVKDGKTIYTHNFLVIKCDFTDGSAQNNVTNITKEKVADSLDIDLGEQDIELPF